MRVLMWEARGDADGIIAWLRADVLPTLPGGVSVELFRSADRVVALVRHTPAEAAADTGAATAAGPESSPMLRLPDPPAELVARPPHAWPFETVA